MDNINEPMYANGKICYIEIPALDIEASASFYQQVFGWRIRKGGDGSTSFDDTVGQVSGMWVLDRIPATETGFVISIMVDSIAATVDLIISQGGTIIKTDTDSSEKTVWFNDPAGNIFGLYQQ